MVALAAVGALAMALPAAAARAPRDCGVITAAGPDDPTPLRGVCDYLDGRQGVVQVALYDTASDTTYRLSDGDDKQITASIVKADILARSLRYYDKRGVAIPDDVPYSIRYLMEHMIENSDNVAATALFHFGGGCEALTRFNRLIPMSSTDVGCESSSYYGWGNTETTAADQVRLMNVYANGQPQGVLSAGARRYGRGLFESVEPDQRFGLTCGPWGDSCERPDFATPDPDVEVGVKNGWKPLPSCTQPADQCPWQVNSIGYVDGKGRDYVAAVLTHRDPPGDTDLYAFNYGIETIQGISQLIWDNLRPANRRG